MAGIASAATAVVLAHIAGGIDDHSGRRRRHHASEPRALRHRRAVRNAGAALSRAASTSGLAARRAPISSRCTPCVDPPEAAETFPQDVMELQAFLAPAGPGQRIQAVPAAGTEVPL